MLSSCAGGGPSVLSSCAGGAFSAVIVCLVFSSVVGFSSSGYNMYVHVYLLHSSILYCTVLILEE